MDTYSVTEAAAELGVSRPTVYKHINRDRSQYMVDIAGKQRISLYGMSLLREAAKMGRPVVDTGFTPKTDEFYKPLTDGVKVKQLEEQVAALERTVKDLTAQLDEARINLAKAEGGAAAMKEAYARSMDALERTSTSKPGWFARLFAGKSSQDHK